MGTELQWEDEKVLEMDGGGLHILNARNCILKNSSNGTFYSVYFTTLKAR